jgi:hypothetical protein
MLEASVESLNLAIIALGLPPRAHFRDESVPYASAVGLIGTAAELSMSACLVQVGGQRALLLPSGQFKTGAMICDEFRKLLQDSPPGVAFLTQGLNDDAAHRTKLLTVSCGFRRLISARAGGLHAGVGPERAVCVILAKEVSTFLEALAQSDRLRSYMPLIPTPPDTVVEQSAIAEDLGRRLAESQDIEEQARLLSALYLILPDIPDEPPEWLEAVRKVSIAPKRRDVVYLLSALSSAIPGSLRRVSKAGEGIPVVVRPDDPNALPIQPEYLRTEFSRMPDQWRGDVANANGRLNQGVFDIPPVDFVKEVFILGLEKVGVLDAAGTLSPHDAWPFVASSLAVQGTPGPYWFLVRHARDLGQLKALIQRAVKIGPGNLKRNAEEALLGIDAIRSNKPVSSGATSLQELMKAKDSAEERHERLAEVVSRVAGTDKDMTKELKEDILKVADGGLPVGPLLTGIVEVTTGMTVATRRYWARVLAEAATTRDDLPGVFAVCRSQELHAVHTAARKALRLIDFLENGPSM